MKAFYFLILLLSVSTSGCGDLILGGEESNDPEHNFELLWNDFDQHYALFEVKSLDWDSLYSVYRPMVTARTTDDELWAVITEMLDHLNDEHVKLRIPAHSPEEYVVYSSGSDQNQHALEEFSIELIASDYVEVLYQKYDYFSFGKLYDHNIGYIHLIAMLGVEPSVVYKALDELGEVDAIIVDVRNNIGGADEYSIGFAEGFSDGEHFLYTVQTRNGPAHSDFDQPLKVHSRPKSPKNFQKPVVVLTDEFTVSAGEIFTLNMRSFEQVTHIGDTTAGAHSDVGPARFLPNGWTYEYSIMKYLLPDGSSLEGMGIAPDIYIQNTMQDIGNGEDKVLEYAIEYLENEIN